MIRRIQLTPIVLALGLISGAAQATLIDRGGGLIYDDMLNITWLQDANYGAGSSYDNGGSNTDGRMTWDNAVAWATNLSYRGYDDWRLPTLAPINGTAFNYNFSYDGSTDMGYNITSSNSELAYMYYVNLGNKGYYDTSGSPQSGYGLEDDPFNPNDESLFKNLPSRVYWSGLAYAPNPGNAWGFSPNIGFQNAYGKSNDFYAWAVRPGDVGAVPEPNGVPEPQTLALVGLGLLGLAAARRRG